MKLVVFTLWKEALKPMFLTKLMMPTAALLTVWAGSSLAIAVFGFTQEKQAAVPSTTPGSQRTTAILDKLETPVSMEFPNEAPLGDVLKFISRAACKGPFDAGLPIYVDPGGLQEAEKTLESTITLNVDDMPLKVTLARVLAQVGLEYTVKDEILFISSPNGIARDKFEAVALPRLLTPRTKAVLAKLDTPIAMPFADATPLEDILKYVSQATTTANSAGISVVVDSFGLQQAGKSLQSTVSIDVEGAPLMTTLRLLLEQLGLAYTIEDGLVVISSSEVIQKLEARLGGR